MTEKVKVVIEPSKEWIEQQERLTAGVRASRIPETPYVEKGAVVYYGTTGKLEIQPTAPPPTAPPYQPTPQEQFQKLTESKFWNPFTQQYERVQPPTPKTLPEAIKQQRDIAIEARFELSKIKPEAMYEVPWAKTPVKGEEVRERYEKEVEKIETRLYEFQLAYQEELATEKVLSEGGVKGFAVRFGYALRSPIENIGKLIGKVWEGKPVGEASYEIIKERALTEAPKQASVGAAIGVAELPAYYFGGKLLGKLAVAPTGYAAGVPKTFIVQKIIGVAGTIYVGKEAYEIAKAPTPERVGVFVARVGTAAVLGYLGYRSVVGKVPEIVKVKETKVLRGVETGRLVKAEKGIITGKEMKRPVFGGVIREEPKAYMMKEALRIEAVAVTKGKMVGAKMVVWTDQKLFKRFVIEKVSGKLTVGEAWELAAAPKRFAAMQYGIFVPKEVLKKPYLFLEAPEKLPPMKAWDIAVNAPVPAKYIAPAKVKPSFTAGRLVTDIELGRGVPVEVIRYYVTPSYTEVSAVAPALVFAPIAEKDLKVMTADNLGLAQIPKQLLQLRLIQKVEPRVFEKTKAKEVLKVQEREVAVGYGIVQREITGVIQAQKQIQALNVKQMQKQVLRQITEPIKIKPPPESNIFYLPKPKPFKPRVPKKSVIGEMMELPRKKTRRAVRVLADPLSLTQAELARWGKAYHPKPTPRLKRRFAERLVWKGAAFRFPAAPEPKRKPKKIKLW